MQNNYTQVIQNSIVQMDQQLWQSELLSTGLNVSAVNITPGDGNCFYHELLQQIHQFETMDSLIPLTSIPNHLQLCRIICQYTQDNQSEISYS